MYNGQSRKEFYFDHDNVRLYADAADFRPFAYPVGWVLLIRQDDGWLMAEYGIAYSALAAQVHAEEAKSRYLRKNHFGSKYTRELSTAGRRKLLDMLSSEAWQIKTYDAHSFLPEVINRKAPYEARVAALDLRDKKRLGRIRNQQRLTAPRHVKHARV